MKTVLFFGYCEKPDVLLACATELLKEKQRVLIVDATTLQKYVWITENGAGGGQQWHAQGIEFVNGVYSQSELEYVLRLSGRSFTWFDWLLVDCDRESICKRWLQADDTVELVVVTENIRYCVANNIRALQDWQLNVNRAVIRNGALTHFCESSARFAHPLFQMPVIEWRRTTRDQQTIRQLFDQQTFASSRLSNYLQMSVRHLLQQLQGINR